MPSLLHRQAEAGRHRRPRRALRAPLRPAGQKVRLSSDPERRQGLVLAKLAALVRDQWGPTDDRSPAGFPGGAALKKDGEGWVYVENEPARALGGALAWAWRNQIARLHVLVEDRDASRVL